jgi:hypothetical protein
VRWDDLFDDLESQLASELDAENRDALADEERARVGRLVLRERLESLCTGSTKRAQLRLELGGAERVVVRPTTFGRDWISGEVVTADSRARGCVVPLHAITEASIAPEEVPRSLAVLPSTGGAPRVSERIGLPFVLRDLCRRRVTVELHATGGVRTGTIDRVARDHLDLAVHELGVERRRRNVAAVLLVPFSSMRRIMM